MATRVYAKLDDDRIEQLDAECRERDVYRPEIVTAAVELYLDTDGHPAHNTIDQLKLEIDHLKSDIKELTETRDSEAYLKNKFKDKFEKAFQTNEELSARIRHLQDQGFFSRASGVKRINTNMYRIGGQE